MPSTEAASFNSGKQVSAGRGEADEGAALVHREPAPLDRQFHAGAVFGRAGLVLEEERPVDLLDVDPAVLYRLDGVGDFEKGRAAFRSGLTVRYCLPRCQWVEGPSIGLVRDLLLSWPLRLDHLLLTFSPSSTSRRCYNVLASNCSASAKSRHYRLRPADFS